VVEGCGCTLVNLSSNSYHRLLLLLLLFIFYLSRCRSCLDFSLPSRCPQVVWCHWGEIEPFSATLAQDGLAECDRPGKNPLKILRRGWELNPGHGEDRQWAISLSYHHPGRGEDRHWAILLSYHDPGHGEDKQWAIPLSYHGSRFRSQTRIIGKENLFDFATIFTRLSDSLVNSVLNLGPRSLVMRVQAKNVLEIAEPTFAPCLQQIKLSVLGWNQNKTGSCCSILVTQ